eukprot:scaffold4213_cov66-Isochrysis_galbana.AAC.1
MTPWPSRLSAHSQSSGLRPRPLCRPSPLPGSFLPTRAHTPVCFQPSHLAPPAPPPRPLPEPAPPHTQYLLPLPCPARPPLPPPRCSTGWRRRLHCSPMAGPKATLRPGWATKPSASRLPSTFGVERCARSRGHGCRRGRSAPPVRWPPQSQPLAPRFPFLFPSLSPRPPLAHSPA